MRVAGTGQSVTTEEYADLVAEQVRRRVRDALLLHGDGTVADPVVLAEAMDDLSVYVPEESPNELATLLAPFWSGAKVCEVLGLASRQALAERRKHGSVLGVKTTDGDVVFPVSQFHRREGRIEVKPPLVPVLRALKAFDPWAVAVILRSQAPELGGLTPLDWVRQGRDEAPLTELAHAIAREWAAGAA